MAKRLAYMTPAKRPPLARSRSAEGLALGGRADGAQSGIEWQNGQKGLTISDIIMSFKESDPRHVCGISSVIGLGILYSGTSRGFLFSFMFEDWTRIEKLHLLAASTTFFAVIAALVIAWWNQHKEDKRRREETERQKQTESGRQIIHRRLLNSYAFAYAISFSDTLWAALENLAQDRVSVTDLIHIRIPSNIPSLYEFSFLTAHEMGALIHIQDSMSQLAQINQFKINASNIYAQTEARVRQIYGESGGGAIEKALAHNAASGLLQCKAFFSMNLTNLNEDQKKDLNRMFFRNLSMADYIDSTRGKGVDAVVDFIKSLDHFMLSPLSRF